MSNVEKFNELMREAHQIHRDIGWWSDPATGEPITRNKGELLALVHTELGEADEAEEYSSMDDKLTHRWGEEVELADACIRLGDYAGGFGYSIDLPDDLASHWMPISPSDYYARLHRWCSKITEHERKGRTKEVQEALRKLVAAIYVVADQRKYDLTDAIEEKMAFNKQRLDHRLEARAAADGKKF